MVLLSWKVKAALPDFEEKCSETRRLTDFVSVLGVDATNTRDIYCDKRSETREAANSRVRT